MGVDIKDGQVGVEPAVGEGGADGGGVVAADDAGQFAHSGVMGHGGLDARRHLAGVADVRFQGLGGVDADGGYVYVQLQVVVLEGGGGGDDGGGAVAGATAKGCGAVDGYGD